MFPMSRSISTEGMVALPGGEFMMGSDRFYPEEAPRRRVRVDPFWIDAAPVTNRQFAQFVAETGYVTVAERPPDPRDYPGMDPALAVPGSLVFHKANGPVALDDPSNWWRFVPGACWQSPLGPQSSFAGLDDHPVVQIAYADAAAYSAWAGKELPTEAQWEYAAWGGREGMDYAWGNELAPAGEMMANYWQGLFPFANQLLDGWEGTSPVGTFPANGFGLSDMIGNVWEWTRDWWSQSASRTPTRSCCVAANPRGGRLRDSYDPQMPQVRIARKVLKGGSHLCAENYCHRYRPAARHPEMIDSATTHIGFRCVVRCKS